jgi:phosphatidate cytidylyltransferase
MLVISGLLFAPFFTEFLEKTSNYLFQLLCLLWILILFKVIAYNKKNINDFFIAFSGTFIFLPFVTSLFFMITMPGIFLYVIIIVSVADSAAFFVGRMAGKTPLLPNISPGKTVEGFIGGVLIASLFSCFIPLFIGLQDYLLEFFILGLLVALISVLGDLFFSMLKRNKDIKDSSHLIPGHGGFIDLLDGTIAILPLLTLLSFRMNELGSILSLIGF